MSAKIESLILLIGLTSLGSASLAQMRTETLSVDDPRPLSAIAAAIEGRTGVPISYEDARYEHTADLEDVTDKVTNAQQKAQGSPNVRVIVPKGGKLTTSITFDPKARSADIEAASAALRSAVSTYNNSQLFGARFQITVRNAAIYVEPVQFRESTGQFKTATSVLATPIIMERQERSGLETLSIIASLLSKSGYRVEVGTVPLRAMINSRVTIGASGESAIDVLTRALASIGEVMQGRFARPTFAYTMLFDPKQRFYALNIRVVQNPNSDHPTHTLPESKPTSSEGVYFKRTP
jgi:hypothetical protein